MAEQKDFRAVFDSFIQGMKDDACKLTDIAAKDMFDLFTEQLKANDAKKIKAECDGDTITIKSESDIKTENDEIKKEPGEGDTVVISKTPSTSRGHLNRKSKATTKAPAAELSAKKAITSAQKTKVTK